MQLPTKARVFLTVFFILAGTVPAAAVQAGESGEKSFFSRALSLFGSGDEEKQAGGVSNFSDSGELIDALRETLAISAERALRQLGEKGGFSNSKEYRIPLPDLVEQFRGPLRAVGREDLLNEFQTTLNRAAESGVAASPEIIRKTIEETTLEELKDLWKGESDAITRFLEKRSRDELAKRMRPEIEKATESSGAARAYKAIESAVPEDTGGFLSKLSAFTGIGEGKNFKLNDYVTEKALDGLFLAMAQEEQKIREDPFARSTELLKKLFKKE